ncbi:MAG: alpha-glucosidase [Clostridiales bacterium]|nr:alpha-glucosidase [Clostridiales bacterium]
MIRRFDFGSPIDTGAVVRSLVPENAPVPYFVTGKQEGKVSFTLGLDADDMIFGLGESVRGINKRGHLYRAWNSDDFSHTENKASIYASHNLLLFFGREKLFGVYFDDPGAVTFDLGYTRGDTAVITSENGDLSVYVIDGESLADICRSFRGLIGRSYLPPKWAFGYIQSRWGYESDPELREIVREHRDRHIPLDGVCMDIDYMDDYKDFTWDDRKFPDLRGFNDDMRAEHIRLIPIIDAGVKQQAGYDVCDEGLEKGYFVKKADGKPFVGAVWPGRSYFPDFLREDVRAWFGGKYARLMDEGIEGFWNDMNEPALFYSEESIAEAFAVADKLRHENLDINSAFALKDAFNGTANSMEDYRRFYHQVDGRTIRHDKVHNLYGAYMTRAAGEGFRRYDSSKRFLMFSRSSFIGAHRYGGVWQGDNNSWWAHIKLNLQMLPSLNMCGFLYNGADLGGFGCDTTEDLLLRWLQLGVFTPLMRNHSAKGTRRQEAYRFANWEEMRDVLTVRYALLPYLYSEFMKAALTDGMYFRPLAFDYPVDDTACRVEDQVMLGADCMIAPVYEQNARGRHVYLPEDMLMVRFRSATDYDLTPMEAGHYWIELALDELPMFIRRGHVIPLAKPAEYVEGIDHADLTLLGWLDEDVTINLYDDDGYTTEPVLEAGLTAITVTVEGKTAAAAGKGLTLRTESLIIGE